MFKVYFKEVIGIRGTHFEAFVLFFVLLSRKEKERRRKVLE